MGLLADLQGFDEEVADVMVNNLYDLQKISQITKCSRTERKLSRKSACSRWLRPLRRTHIRSLRTNGPNRLSF